jgi:site-specific DNA-methyltransferase (adenine-specific)
MKPYYQDDFVTLYHGDCLEITAWTEADVLVTDPPYGMAFQSGSRKEKHDRIAGDDSVELRDSALSIWSAEKPALVFGTWRAPRPAGGRVVGIWDKTDGTGPGMGDLKMPFGSSHEEFYLLGPWNRHGKRHGSVIRTAVGGSNYTSKVGHPTPKPLVLMEQIIEVCPPGSVIADPFAGSGSTLLAARNLGHKVIGVELEERYCELVAGRLNQGVLL